jgi:hypothetical protein
MRESTSITIERSPVLTNPVKPPSPALAGPTPSIAAEMTATRDGVRGKEKLDVLIKFIWNYASNTIINQHWQYQ